MKTLTMKVIQCALIYANEPLVFTKKEMATRGAVLLELDISMLHSMLFRDTEAFDDRLAVTNVLSSFADQVDAFLQQTMYAWKDYTYCIPRNAKGVGLNSDVVYRILSAKETTDDAYECLHVPEHLLTLTSTPKENIPGCLIDYVLFANGQRSSEWHKRYRTYSIKSKCIGIREPSRVCIVRGALAEIVLLPLVDMTAHVGKHERIHVDALIKQNQAVSPDLLLWRCAEKDLVIVEVKFMALEPRQGSKDVVRSVEMATKQVCECANVLPAHLIAPFGLVVLLFPGTEGDGLFTARILEVPILMRT